MSEQIPDSTNKIDFIDIRNRLNQSTIDYLQDMQKYIEKLKSDGEVKPKYDLKYTVKENTMFFVGILIGYVIGILVTAYLFLKDKQD